MKNKSKEVIAIKRKLKSLEKEGNSIRAELPKIKGTRYYGQVKNELKSTDKKLIEVRENLSSKEIHAVIMEKTEFYQSITDEIHEKELRKNKLQEELTILEDTLNCLKVGKAKTEADIESLNFELREALR